MFSKYKKVIIAIVFLIVVIALAYLIYYFFFKPIAPSVTPGQVLQPSGGQLPSIGQGNLNRAPLNLNGALPKISRIPEGVQVSEIANGSYTKVNEVVGTKATAPVIARDGNVNYYNAAEGYFYKRNADGSLIRIGSQRFYQVEKVTWSPDGNSAVLEYPDGSNIFYNFSSNKQYTLPPELQQFNFSQDGGRLAAEAIGPKEENNWIVTANPDGSNIQFVERLGNQADNVDVNWSPNGQVVAMFRKNTGLNSQEVIFIGQNQENFKALTVYGRGFEGQWTPSGDKVLYSVYREEDGFRPSLWVTNASGENIGINNSSLGLSTWADKCLVAKDNFTAFCAVPEDLPEGSGIYPALNQNSDIFYKVNLSTGQKTMLASPVSGDNTSGSYQAGSLSLSPDEKILYFQDLRTGRVHSLRLE